MYRPPSMPPGHETALSETAAELLRSLPANHSALPAPLSNHAAAAAHIGMWEWDIGTDRIAWSPEAEEIFGHRPGTLECTFDGFLVHVHAADREKITILIQQALADRQPYAADHRITLPGGTIRWVSCRGRAIADRDGTVSGMAGTVEDITHRKETEFALLELQRTLEQRVQERTAGLEQAVRDLEREVSRRRQIETALSDSERRYQILYEQNPTMYFTLTRDGTVLSVNRFGAEQLGYRPDELIGRSVLAVFEEANHQTVLGQLQTCIDHPGQTFDWEIQKIRKDGCRLWVKERARTVDDPQGHPLILVVCEDITERRRVEDAIREREQRLRSTTQFLDTLVRESPLPIVSLDQNGRVSSWNQAATALFGWTESDVLGKELPYVPAGEEAEADRLWELGTKNLIRGPLPIRRLRKDGTPLDLLLWPMFVYEEDGTLATAIGLYVDQSDLQRAEEGLRKSESRFRAFASAMPDIAFVLDEHGRYMEIFGHGEDLLYADAAQLRNRLLHEVLPKADADFVLAIIRKTVETGHSQHVEYQLKVKAGVLWFEGHTSLMQPVSGKHKQIVWIAHNITERKHAELALRENEQAIRSLQEAASSSGLTLDQRIHTVLELGCRRFGLPVSLMTATRGEHLIVTHAWDPTGRFVPGMQLPLCDSPSCSS